MRAYCKILDENTGLVQKGNGCPDEYYIAIGMEIRDIKQSDIDSEWYLTEKCPMKPEPTPEEIAEKINSLTMTAWDFVNVLKTAGLTSADILEFLNSNPDIQLHLTCCKNVYCGVAKSLMPITYKKVTITKEMVERAFKDKHGIQ
jgi:hypothetical protein